MAGGTVVGTQTSSLDAKDVLDGLTPMEDVLAAIATGARGVRRFQYKAPIMRAERLDKNGRVVKDETLLVSERPWGGEEFEGVVIDYAPRYGMDADEAHPAGRSLNTITVIGDLLRAVAHLTERVERLEQA